MGNYVVAIEGRFPLAQIELELRNEEAGASEFVSMRIGQQDGKDVNLATFRELDSGMPKPLTLKQVPPGAPPPAGKVRVWEGRILAENKRLDAALYRDA